MAINYTEMPISELGERDVLENQREVKAIDIVIRLTPITLCLTSAREPVNLALLDKVVVRIVYPARYLTMRVQEIQGRQRKL